MVDRQALLFLELKLEDQEDRFKKIQKLKSLFLPTAKD
jgi:hypothetical protein